MYKLIGGVIATLLLVAACTGVVQHKEGARSQTVTIPPASSASQESGTTDGPRSTATTQVPGKAAQPGGPTVLATGGQSKSTAKTTAEACLRYQGHTYEVCTAYIANSSLAVLVPYYKYARGSNHTLARYVTYRLGSRYTVQAYQLIKSRVASWPAGAMEVSVPHIRIVSVHSSLQTNTATLVTRETWLVTTQKGKVVYQETNQRHTVTMRRVPSYLLHKWVVTDLR